MIMVTDSRQHKKSCWLTISQLSCDFSYSWMLQHNIQYLFEYFMIHFSIFNCSLKGQCCEGKWHKFTYACSRFTKVEPNTKDFLPGASPIITAIPHKLHHPAVWNAYVMEPFMPDNLHFNLLISIWNSETSCKTSFQSGSVQLQLELSSKKLEQLKTQTAVPLIKMTNKDK